MPKKGSAGKDSTESKQNNPYSESGHLRVTQPVSATEARSPVSFDRSRHNASHTSFTASEANPDNVHDSGKSVAPTIATKAETVHSEAGFSRAATTRTLGAVSSTDGADGDSTFSAPDDSQQSRATTPATIQSTSINHGLDNALAGHNSTASASHSYNAGAAPGSGIPQHLTPSGQPQTYSGATANNMLTDDASILTLASSSKKGRRRSMDTEASVRALAPNSVWDSGSRESLPLSVLSGTFDPQGQSRPNAMLAERGSIYPGQSVGAPALVSERNSYYAASHRQVFRDKDSRSIDGRSLHNRDADDGKSLTSKSLLGADSLKHEGSVRSGAPGHTRSDSIPMAPDSGSPTGTTSIRAFEAPSRTNSTLGHDID